MAVAGTFDHLHLGHKKLLATAKASGKKFIVGLCRQSMLKNKPYPQSLQEYAQRKQSLNKLGFTKITPLTDIYGPAASLAAIEAIVCSPLSRPNAEKINSLRQLPLKIIEIPLVCCTNGQPLSSSLIRQGLVDRRGFYYPQIFNRDLKLPLSLRPLLQKPFSPIIKKISRPKFGVIAVGDIAAISLLKEKITPDLAIVDLKTKRQQIFPHLQSLGLQPGLKASNPAGMITKNLVKRLLICLSQKQPTLLIDGEEDLAVLPAVLLSPLNTTVFYGQPDQGLVKINVSEITKAKALKFLKAFTSLGLIPKFL